MINDNKQCCSSLPIKQGYQSIGQFEEFLGYDSYVTGPLNAEKVAIVAFDIFRFSSQILQGADLLASQGVRVIMPDFFKGAEIDAACFGPNQTPKQAAEVQNFFSGPANPGASLESLAQMVQQLKADGAKTVIGVGFCWGGKLCILSKALDAVALVHPSMLTAEDAQPVNVPVCLLTSKDEDAEVMLDVTNTLMSKPIGKRCVFKHYPDSQHGWAAARANLSKEDESKTFEDAYLQLISFIEQIA